MVVVYKCDEGYSLIGPSTRVCQSSGNWSGEEPVCATVHQHEEFQMADEEKEGISSFHVKMIVAFLVFIILFCGFCLVQLLDLLTSLLSYFTATFPLIYFILKLLDLFTQPRRR